MLVPSYQYTPAGVAPIMRPVMPVSVTAQPLAPCTLCSSVPCSLGHSATSPLCVRCIAERSREWATEPLPSASRLVSGSHVVGSNCCVYAVQSEIEPNAVRLVSPSSHNTSSEPLAAGVAEMASITCADVNT